MGNESSSQKNKNNSDKRQPIARSQTLPNVQEVVIDFPPLKHGTKSEIKTNQPPAPPVATTNTKEVRKTGVPEDLKMAIENWKLVTPDNNPELKLEKEGGGKTNPSTTQPIRDRSYSSASIPRNAPNPQEETKYKTISMRPNSKTNMQNLLVQALRDELSLALDEIKAKEETIQSLMVAQKEKDLAIKELTEKVIEIKKQIQVLTNQKNKKIKDLQEELNESEREEEYQTQQQRSEDLIMQLKIELAEADQRFAFREQEIFTWKEKLLTLFPSSSGIISSIISDSSRATSRSNSSASSNNSDNSNTLKSPSSKQKEKNLSKSHLKKYLSDFSSEDFNRSKDSLGSTNSDKQAPNVPSPQKQGKPPKNYQT